MKKVWGYILLLVTIGCLLSVVPLTYDLWKEYRRLQAYNASGVDYLGFLFVPAMYLLRFVIALLSLAGYRKLTENHSAVCAWIGIFLHFGCVVSVALIALIVVL